MKKVLLATTALVAFAGAAAAEVSLSGSAEMGIANDGSETLFFQSVDVRFRLTGETDGGLTFGATVDMEDAIDSGLNGEDNIDVWGDFADFTVFVSGSFGTLTLGDTDGAFDWALTEVAMGTAIFDDHTAHSGYSGNGGFDGDYNGQVARYDYSFGDFAVAVSLEVDPVLDPQYGIGLRYSADVGGIELGVGAGFQSSDVDDVAGISISAASGGITGVLNYSEADNAYDSHMAIGVGYETGALLVHANYGEYDYGGFTESGMGVVVNYDLGGGAVVAVGFGDSEFGDSTWSAGLSMSF